MGTWNARSREPVEPGATVEIIALEGLTLQVRERAVRKEEAP